MEEQGNVIEEAGPLAKTLGYVWLIHLIFRLIEEKIIMDVSVVIPLFNGEEHVRETLDSVLAQTLSPHEIVVVDDGSTDASPTIVKEYSEVQLLMNPGDGSNAARNHSFHHTSAGAVAFLDQDDLWHPQHLQHLSEVLTDRPDSPAAFAGKATFYDNETPQYSLASPDARQYDPWEDFPKNTLGEPVLALIRSEALRLADGWSSEYEGCSDYHLWLKLALQGALVVNKATTAAHRKHTASYGSKLREEKLVRYYSRHVAASKDALIRRRNAGLTTESYERRYEAQEALIGLLGGLTENLIDKQLVAVRQFDRKISGTSQKAFTNVYKTFRWYLRPYVWQVGRRQHALELLTLVNHWPNSESRLREAFRVWAYEHLPAKVLLQRSPYSPSCWLHLLKRLYRKAPSLIE